MGVQTDWVCAIASWIFIADGAHAASKMMDKQIIVILLILLIVPPILSIAA
jgi:hypothetical protein